MYCSSPEGFCELPKGLPNNALAEVVAVYVDNTHVRYSGVTFALRNDCVHRAFPDSRHGANESAPLVHSLIWLRPGFPESAGNPTCSAQ